MSFSCTRIEGMDVVLSMRSKSCHGLCIAIDPVRLYVTVHACRMYSPAVTKTSVT